MSTDGRGNVDTSTFQEKLSGYINQYREYSKEADKITEEKLRTKNVKGSNQKVFLRDGKLVIEEIPEKTLSNELPEEINAFLDQNIDQYLAASPEDQTALRNLCEDDAFNDFLCRYAGRANEKLRDTKDDVWLTRGLAAISMENFWIDFRDVIGGIHNLNKTALELSIDSRPIFHQVAAASSQEIPRGGPTSLREVLNNVRG